MPRPGGASQRKSLALSHKSLESQRRESGIGVAHFEVEPAELWIAACGTNITAWASRSGCGRFLWSACGSLKKQLGRLGVYFEFD